MFASYPTLDTIVSKATNNISMFASYPTLDTIVSKATNNISMFASYPTLDTIVSKAAAERHSGINLLLKWPALLFSNIMNQ